MSILNRNPPAADKAPRLPQRHVEADRITPRDPKVLAFLEQHSAMEAHREDLGRQVESMAVQAAIDRREIEFLRSELATTKIQRDEYQRGYVEIKCQVAILATAAVSALENSKAQFLRVGIDHDKPASGHAEDAIETSLKAIGEKFGANNREEDAGAHNDH